MRIVFFITHPEVTIDPGIPVSDWSLSPIGQQRMHRVLEQPWLGRVRSIFSSCERKSCDAAAILADHLRVSPVTINALGENDRSATGYLPKAEFAAVADQFFARPQDSVRGWERAIDAQQRIRDAVDRAIAGAECGDIAIVSHGGVGALLLCHLKAMPISRSEDQPGDGGGNLFCFDADTRRLLSDWCRMEEYQDIEDRARSADSRSHAVSEGNRHEVSP